MGSIDTNVQLKPSHCEVLENISSLDVVITESEFDKNVIKDLLVGVWVSYFSCYLKTAGFWDKGNSDIFYFHFWFLMTIPNLTILASHIAFSLTSS